MYLNIHQDRVKISVNLNNISANANSRVIVGSSEVGSAAVVVVTEVTASSARISKIIGFSLKIP